MASKEDKKSTKKDGHERMKEFRLHRSTRTTPKLDENDIALQLRSSQAFAKVFADAKIKDEELEKVKKKNKPYDKTWFPQSTIFTI